MNTYMLYDELLLTMRGKPAGVDNHTGSFAILPSIIDVHIFCRYYSEELNAYIPFNMCMSSK